ncbi:MAG TPA: hypothetical protein VM783_18025 [Candidatus Acidoferrum sp.]|nr:hypothetical protein [Candidatus Acidoferrum sp.]
MANVDRKDARRMKRATELKFKKLDALHKVAAPAKTIRQMSDSWMRRQVNDPKGFYKASNAKPGMVLEVLP